jgi:L-iditol 2-dehydrogenase
MSNESIETVTSSGGARIHAASIRADSIQAERIEVEKMSVEKIRTEPLATEKISARPIVTLPTIPATMRAAVYRGVNDVRVETVPVPVDADGTIGAGEVLVRIDTCGICGTDLKKIHSGSHSAPRIFGHEMAGTIVMLGAGVEHFAIGDRVMAYHHIPCGECYYCRKRTFSQCETYKKVGCTAGFAPAGGGFAEYIRVADWIVGKPGKTAGLIRIPDDIPFE